MREKLTGRKFIEGFSTLEILVAFSILTLTVTTMAVVFYQNQNMNLEATLNEIAIYKGKAFLDEAILKGFEVKNEILQDGVFKKEITTEWLSNSSKKITSKVSYNSPRLQEVILSEIISRKDYFDGDTCDLFLTSDWNNPISIKSITDSEFDNITDADVFNKKIYVTSNSSTVFRPDFHIIDISSPSSVKTKSINTGPGINALKVAERYVYAANSSINSQLQIIDISDADNPVVMLNFKLPLFSGVEPEDRIGISVFYSNKKIYLGTDISDGEEFHIIDVSSPLDPVWLGSFEVGASINDIHVFGEKAYLATTGEKQMWVLDVSNPMNISEIGNVAMTKWMTQSGKSLYGIGEKIYLGRTYGGTSSSNHELHVVDAVSSFQSQGSKKIGKSINDVFWRNNILFLATKDNAKEFQTWNVEDPENIKEGGFIDFEGEGVGVDCEDDLIYFATPNSIEIIKGDE